jgi:hypothetical protein
MPRTGKFVFPDCTATVAGTANKSFLAFAFGLGALDIHLATASAGAHTASPSVLRAVEFACLPNVTILAVALCDVAIDIAGPLCRARLAKGVHRTCDLASQAIVASFTFADSLAVTVFTGTMPTARLAIGPDTRAPEATFWTHETFDALAAFGSSRILLVGI